MAGIYEIWRDPTKDRDDDSAWLRTCSVITTQATDAAGHIHDRMPMVIRREAIDAWLDPTLTDPEQALRLLAVTEADALEAYAVSTEVNSVQNNDPSLKDPIAYEPDEPDADPTAPGHAAVSTGSRDHPGRRPRRARRGSTSPAAEEQRAVLVLGHGAGGGVNAMDLELLARRLPERGITVLRFEQPWRTAGRKVAAPPPKLDEAWLAAVGWLVDQPWTPARCSSAAGAPAPGWPAGPRTGSRSPASSAWRSRCTCPASRRSPGPHELLAPRAPRLVLQGTNDSFGRPEEIRAAIGDRPGHLAGRAARCRPWLSGPAKARDRSPPADLRATRWSARSATFVGPADRRIGGNITGVTALRLTCRCSWTPWPSGRRSAARRYSHT